MKKIKLISSVILALLCIAVLGLGVYAATPATNEISGTITVNSASAEIILSVYKYNADGTKQSTPFWGPHSTRVGREISLNSMAFDLSKIETEADLSKASIKYLFEIQNTSESKDLGVYFTSNVVTDKAKVGATLAASDIKTEIPLNATLKSDSSKNDAELVKAVFENGYCKLTKKESGNNGTCSLIMEFALNKIPTSEFEVKLSSTKNPIYLNVEEYQEPQTGELSLNDKLFNLMGYEVLTPGENGKFTIPTGKEKIKIAEGQTTIAQDAFYNCRTITHVVIPYGVTGLGYFSFMECSNLAYVLIPYSVTEINTWCFDGCTNLKSIVIPDCVRLISKGAFSRSGLTRIVLPSITNLISESAFDGCYYLTEIVIPDGVTKIGTRAFLNCRRLTNIVIPANVSEISADAFTGCTGFETITVKQGTAFAANKTITLPTIEGKTWYLNGTPVVVGSTDTIQRNSSKDNVYEARVV